VAEAKGVDFKEEDPLAAAYHIFTDGSGKDGRAGRGAAVWNDHFLGATDSGG
jgi:hypothetical protein